MKNSQLLLALSLLLACSFVQSIKIGETLYEITFEWPMGYVESIDKYNKKYLPDGCKADNFALKHFQSNLGYNYNCTESQKPQCRSKFSYNPQQISPADYKYLNNYIGFSEMSSAFGGSDQMLKMFVEVYKSCCDKKTQVQFFGDMAAAHRKFSIIKTLASKGIVPSKTKFYTQEQVYSALKDLFGGIRPVLFCEASYGGSTYFGFLTGIQLTLDENLNVTKDCQKSNGYGYCDSYKEFRFLPL